MLRLDKVKLQRPVGRFKISQKHRLDFDMQKVKQDYEEHYLIRRKKNNKNARRISITLALVRTALAIQNPGTILMTKLVLSAEGTRYDVDQEISLWKSV